MNIMFMIILIVSLAYYISDANSLCAPDYCQTHGPFSCPAYQWPCDPPGALFLPVNSTECRCCPLCIIYNREFIIFILYQLINIKEFLILFNANKLYRNWGKLHLCSFTFTVDYRRMCSGSGLPQRSLCLSLLMNKI